MDLIILIILGILLLLNANAAMKTASTLERIEKILKSYQQD
jgi:hypothetical protein